MSIPKILETEMQTCNNYFDWENDFKGLTRSTKPNDDWIQ